MPAFFPRNEAGTPERSSSPDVRAGQVPTGTGMKDLHRRLALPAKTQTIQSSVGRMRTPPGMRPRFRRTACHQS
jgi:hypothetical protein